MLSVSTGGGSAVPWRGRNGGESGSSRATSVQGRRSGEIMGITEEEEEEEEEVEEVDFKAALREGEVVVDEAGGR